MKYHLIINGFNSEWISQVEKMNGFRKKCLEEMEEGEAYLLSESEEQAREIVRYLSTDTVLIRAKYYQPEWILESLCSLMNQEDIYIFGQDYAGAELVVRAAARKKGSSVVAVHDLTVNAEVTAKKMVYTNHMEGGFLMKKAPYCISIANGMEQITSQEGEGRIIEVIDCTERNEHIVSRKIEITESVKGLEDTKVAVIAGRGAKNKEQVKKLAETAKMIGGELGVSRPAAMNAWAPLHRLVGVSGAIIQPDICITAGVSGAAAFYAGIDKSKFIIAINSDERAPIMKKADIAVADDFVPVMDALRALIED